MNVKLSKIGIIPGSFDPFHIAHVRVIETVRSFFEGDLIIVTGRNYGKRMPLFSAEDRAEMIHVVGVRHGWDVRVEILPEGVCLASYAFTQWSAHLLFKGLRPADLTEHLTLTAYIRALCPEMKVIPVILEPELVHVSSSGIKELLHVGDDPAMRLVRQYLPEVVYNRVIQQRGMSL